MDTTNKNPAGAASAYLDRLALNAAAAIMDLPAAKELPGGTGQLKAKIQCEVASALHHFRIAGKQDALHPGYVVCDKEAAPADPAASPSPTPAQQQEPRTPTDLSKRLREAAGAVMLHADRAKLMRDAADEIERYYGGMLAWKRTAEAKDRASAETAAPGASIGDDPEFNRLIGQLIAEDNALSVEGIVEALVEFLDKRSQGGAA